MSNKWIENNSGVCPVAQGTLIDITYRNGEEYFAVPALEHLPGIPDASSNFWDIDNINLDITYWRLHKPELTLEDAWDEPDIVPWTEATNYNQGEYPTYQQRERLIQERLYKRPETPPLQPPKKSVEQLAIDVLHNTTGKLYTEREIIAIMAIVTSIKELEK